MKPREGYKFVKSFEDDEKCVGIIEFRGEVIVATEKAVYRMVDEKLIPIEMEVEV